MGLRNLAKKYKEYENKELARRAVKKKKVAAYRELARKKTRRKIVIGKFSKKNYIKAIGDPYK